AFGLYLFSVEDTVVSKAALGQRLSIVFEGVRRWLGASVDHIQHLVVLSQGKVDIRPVALDRARQNVSSHAQTLGVSAVAHATQFFDGDVVALALLHAGVGEVPERQHNDDYRAAELQDFAVLRRHLMKLYSRRQGWSR